ncbi:MAG: hypothetical protein K9I94_09820 [Bacteroidales bacterium]|nr:hypothetical protein [Bacteroidales bacterium]
MKKVLFIFIMLLSGLNNVIAQDVNIDKVRAMYFSMDEEPCVSKRLATMLNNIPNDGHGVFLAYKGASSAASAACVKGGIEKLKHFVKGKKTLEKAVKQAPENLEIRFLRFATQVESPGFLGYQDNINEDKQFLINYLPEAIRINDNVEHLHKMLDFMVASGELSANEKQLLNKLLIKDE